MSAVHDAPFIPFHVLQHTETLILFQFSKLNTAFAWNRIVSCLPFWQAPENGEGNCNKIKQSFRMNSQFWYSVDGLQTSNMVCNFHFCQLCTWNSSIYSFESGLFAHFWNSIPDSCFLIVNITNTEKNGTLQTSPLFFGSVLSQCFSAIKSQINLWISQTNLLKLIISSGFLSSHSSLCIEWVRFRMDLCLLVKPTSVWLQFNIFDWLMIV